jgi:hypothetical protein
MKDEPLVRCPKCNTDSLVRVMGAGSGIIFKGSGFYLTDYKKTGSTAGNKEGSKKTDGASTDTSKPPSPSGDSSKPTTEKKKD